MWFIDLDVDIDINTQNIACLGKAVPVLNKQHVSNIWGSIHSKVKQHWGWVKESVAYKKKLVHLFFRGKQPIPFFFISTTALLLLLIWAAPQTFQMDIFVRLGTN